MSALFDETADLLDESTFPTPAATSSGSCHCSACGGAPLWADDSRIVFMFFEFFDGV